MPTEPERSYQVLTEPAQDESHHENMATRLGCAWSFRLHSGMKLHVPIARGPILVCQDRFRTFTIVCIHTYTHPSITPLRSFPILSTGPHEAGPALRKKSPVVTAGLPNANDPKEVLRCKRPTGNDGMKTRGLDDIAVSFLG